MKPARNDKPEPRSSVVRELHPTRGRDAAAAAWGVSDATLVSDLRSGSTTAAALLFDRYAIHVERLLFSLLGPEGEAEDILHEIFVRALEGIDSVEDPSRLRSWLTGITVYTAREWIRRRVRRRWLHFVEELPEPPQPPQAAIASEEVNEATRCAFAVLEGMSSDDRVFFSLRFIEGMELSEVALACDVSVSTAKRRLKDAEKHFVRRARRHEALLSWMEEGGRWAID